MHKYGFYEIRCKLPEQPGWWAAFWLQSPCIGSTLNPEESGVEVDIMENFTRDGIVSHNNHWNGYGADHKSAGSGERKLKETPDGFHVFGSTGRRTAILIILTEKNHGIATVPFRTGSNSSLFPRSAWATGTAMNRARN